MNTKLNILLLEDSEADAALIQRLVKKELNALSVTITITTNKVEFINALTGNHFDIVLSDNSLPTFSGTEALEIVLQQKKRLPFILITGTVSEEFAANILRKGADDYILKDRMTRLPSAIEGALQKYRIKKEKREALENLQAIFDNSSEGFVLVDIHGLIKAFNTTAVKSMLHTTDIEMITGQPVTDFVEPDRKEMFDAITHKVLAGEMIQYDRKYKKGESVTWLNFSFNPVYQNNMISGICITGRDITEKVLAERQRTAEHLEEQKKITLAILNAQETERNNIGAELHDNVNQILVATNLLLSSIKKNPEKATLLIETSMQQLKLAINENRKIAHTFVTPDLRIETLQQQLKRLSETMFAAVNVSSQFDYSHFNEQLLNDDFKITIYRIAQEQCTNIVKYAQATTVQFILTTNDNQFTMKIADNGMGTETDLKSSGIGLRNITGRLSLYNGTASVITAPGKGFCLSIQVPLATVKDYRN